MTIPSQRRLALVFFLVVLLIAGPPAGAADFTVGADSACTLADAIQAANSDSAVGGCPAGQGHDTIVVSGDIFLNERLPDIRSAVTIRSDAAASNRQISGQDRHVIFAVTDFGFLELRNLTLRDGNGGGGQGGAIRVTNGTASLSNVLVDHSVADAGGGIAVQHGQLNCSQCTFTNNQGKQGGALYLGAGANARLTDSRIKANKGFNGGGIYIDHAYVTLSNTLIGGYNRARDGGGIYMKSGKAIFENNVDVIGNDADFHGGGIYVKQGTLDLIGDNSNDITHNVAIYGGGIVLENADSTISGARFTGNAATEGRDIYVANSDLYIEPGVSISPSGIHYH